MDVFGPSIEARQNSPSEELFYQIRNLEGKLKRSSLSYEDKAANYAYLEGLRDIESVLLKDYPSKTLLNGFYKDSFAKLARLQSSVDKYAL